ncbi:hypothetical protein HPG69_011610, partial [Diceros bicornis minor]
VQLKAWLLAQVNSCQYTGLQWVTGSQKLSTSFGTMPHGMTPTRRVTTLSSVPGPRRQGSELREWIRPIPLSGRTTKYQPSEDYTFGARGEKGEEEEQLRRMAPSLSLTVQPVLLWHSVLPPKEGFR